MNSSRVSCAVVALAALASIACEEKTMGSVDREDPAVSISSPAANAEVSGVSFRVEVDATDNEAVDRVEFRINSGPPVSVPSAPFAATVVTLAETGGATLTIAVEAFDAAGNSASETITTTVAPRTIAQLTTNVNDDMHPAWSPDGTEIAFQADRNDATFDIWKMNADGSSQTRLTTNVNDDRNPAWSPDGDWIAFDSSRAGGGTFDVWVMPVATGEPDVQALTFGTNDDVEPNWAPSGSYVFFASSRGTNGDFNIWKMPATGDDITSEQITAFPVDDTAPAVSTDGSDLVFTSLLNFTTEHVYTKTLGVEEVAPLTGDTGFTEKDPTWSPDGTVVLFTRGEGLDANLWIVPVGAQVPVQVTFGAGTIGDGGAAWSPDGSKIAFHSDRDGNPDIYVIE